LELLQKYLPPSNNKMQYIQKSTQLININKYINMIGYKEIVSTLKK